MEKTPVYVVLSDLKNVLILKLTEMEGKQNACALKRETFKMGIEKINFLQSLIIQNHL